MGQTLTRHILPGTNTANYGLNAPYVRQAIASLASRDAVFQGKDFRRIIMADPFLANNLRLSDIVRQYGGASEAIEIQLTRLFPEGSDTEYINVYPNNLADPLNPEIIGIGKKNHAHPKSDEIKSIVAAQQGLAFLHGAVTSFIGLTDKQGNVTVISGVRGPKKDHEGTIESVFGGHAQAGDSLVATVIRERKEELGVTSRNVSILECIKYPVPQSDHTYDWVAALILNKAQTTRFLEIARSRNLTIFPAKSADELRAFLPGNIKQTTGSSWQEIAKNGLAKFPGGKEVVYVLRSKWPDLKTVYI